MALTRTVAVLVFSVGPLVTGYALRPSLTRAILRDLRIPRILHYVVLVGLGLALAHQAGAPMNLDTLWSAAGFCLALAYAAVFAIVTNNLEDLPADEVSNRERPLVQKTVEPQPYLRAGIVCLVTSLAIAACVSFEVAVATFAISALYFAYSCRPLRLKRIPVVAKLVIGVNSLTVALCGFALAADGRTFPLGWALYLVGPLALAANFVDLKDLEGDRRQGVATLPVLLGLPRARLVIAAATLLAYACAGWLLGLWWVVPFGALLAAVHVWLLFRQPYREGPVFLVYVSGLLGLDALLFL